MFNKLHIQKFSFIKLKYFKKSERNFGLLAKQFFLTHICVIYIFFSQLIFATSSQQINTKFCRLTELRQVQIHRCDVNGYCFAGLFSIKPGGKFAYSNAEITFSNASYSIILINNLTPT